MRFGSLFYYHMREKGIHVQEGFPCFLTTAHTEADIERIVKAFQDTIAEMQADGMLPGAAENAPRPVLAQASGSLVEAPVTEAQREIWLSDQIGADASCSYNESFSLVLKGELNESALRASILEIINRHEALRATFSEDGEQIKVAPSLSIEIPLIDLTSLSPSERDKRRIDLLAEDARTPFDLMQGPLVRVKLLRLEPQSYVAVFYQSSHCV